MRIRTKTKIGALITVGLVLFLGLFVYLTAQQVANSAQKEMLSEAIIGGVFDLSILTQDYLLYKEERAKKQWTLSYNKIETSFDSRLFNTQEEIEIVEDLTRSYTELDSIFSKLTNPTISKELEDRLTSQLLIKLDKLVFDSFKLASINQAQLTKALSFDIFIQSVVLLLIIVTLLNAYLTLKISGPLAKLTKGTEIIGKGNLEHRIDIKSKDEIGQLAMSFNEMTTHLQKSYEGLEEKVRERTVELEVAKNKSETLLASIGDGVFGIDKEQKIIYFNQRAEEISGYKTDEAIGRQYYDVLKFVTVKDKSENTKFIRTALKGTTTEMSDHTVLIRKDKKEVPVADSASPIKDKQGKVLGAIVVFRDASQERELDRTRAELISFAGHQLKAPLTYMSGNVEMLKEGKFNAESRELIDEIEKGIKEMKALVRDVLNISRIEQGSVKLKPEPTQLEEVVDDIIKESLSVAKQRNVNVEFTKSSQPLPELDVDPQYIHEVFKNVISNAIKYTKDKVTISFEKKDGDILFTCTDNGIGIPEDEQDKIFTKFYTASNAVKAETKGTGLGLSIAKVLIEKMNGKIWFESEENEGTTFYISLPFVA